MVSPWSMAGMSFSALVSLFFPILWIVWLWRKHHRISWSAVGMGALVFMVFSLVLEYFLHLYVLKVNPNTATLMKNPYVFAIYSAFAAGVFEEVGRYLAIRYWLKKCESWSDGVSYGIGQGGVASLLMGCVAALQLLQFAVTINSGQWSAMTAHAPAGSLTSLHDFLTTSAPYVFALGGLEQMIAFLIQIALSLFVLYGVRRNHPRILPYAILLHTVIELLPSLSQTVTSSLWLVEGERIVIGAICVWWIAKARKLLAETA